MILPNKAFNQTRIKPGTFFILGQLPALVKATVRV
jgi:hypothetical protein